MTIHIYIYNIIYIHTSANMWLLHVGNIPFYPWWIMPASPGYEARFLGMKMDDQTSPSWCILVIYNLHHAMCIYIYIYLYTSIYMYNIHMNMLPPQTYLFNMSLASFPYHGSTAVDRWTLDRCVVRKKSCCRRLVRTNFCWKQQCLDFQCTMLVNKNMFPTLFSLFLHEQCLSRKAVFLWISKNYLLKRKALLFRRDTCNL